MRNRIIAALGAFLLSAGTMHAQTPTTPSKPIDINTASRTQLAEAGWGQYADAIIAARPYKSMNDLVAKNVVPATAYEKGATQFVIGDGTTPLSNPGQSQTLNPPTVTPPTVTPGTTPPSVTQPAVPQRGTTPPSVQPGAASPTPGTTAPASPSSGATTSPAK